MEQLIASGLKVTPENVVATGVTPDGRTVWLETGNAYSGLQHVLADQGKEFSHIGIASSAVPALLIGALRQGEIVGTQGVDRPIFKATINGQSFGIAIAVDFNGYIVGANPAGRLK